MALVITVVLLLAMQAIIMGLVGSVSLYTVVDRRQRSRRSICMFAEWLALSATTVALEMTGHTVALAVGMLAWFGLLIVALLVGFAGKWQDA